MSKRVLLLSAYHGESHKRWCDGLMAQFSHWQWTLESLPARHFSWRTRGNSLTWGMGDHSSLRQPYDLLIVTSMVDLTALRGFRPELANLPTLVYFHENQFAYPKNAHLKGTVEIQLTSIYTALVADKLIFNSQFNIETFLTGAQKLLKKLPDGVPGGLVERIRKKSCVIPVPVDDVLIDEELIKEESIKEESTAQSSRTVHVLWNHRWEWDKGPQRLLAIIEMLASQKLLGRRFKFHIAGQKFRTVPEEFPLIHKILAEHNALETWGYVEDYQDYQRIMEQCDVVLSTASHDFQGLSMIEAAQRGCIPLAPNDLAYPEWFGDAYLYDIKSKNESRIANNVIDALVSWYPLNSDQSNPIDSNTSPSNTDQSACMNNNQRRKTPVDCSALTWSYLKSKYQHVFDQLINTETPQ